MAGVELSAVLEPYCVVVPYSTCASAGSFVVQVILAPVCVIAVAVTALIVGGVVSAVVLLR